ncbi:hypothetical protein Tco_0725814 [Tanacetum coccineum]|uniref:Uncharacterized protein n=1 Tax=Tanacetum coccineum TaxID=301880 RepID=A0ABQ4YG58_9ASTR
MMSQTRGTRDSRLNSKKSDHSFGSAEEVDHVRILQSCNGLLLCTGSAWPQSAGDKLRDKNAKESWALLEDLSFYDNKSWNDPSDFSKLVKAISLPQDVSSTSDRRLVELKSSPTLDGSSFCSDTTYSSEQNHFLIPKAQMNFTSTNYHTEEELQGNGIKSPSKLLSLKYLSQSSLAELSKNPSSSKCVYFVNSIIILNKEDKAEEEGSLKSGATEYRNLKMTITDEEEVESEEEFEEGTKEETKEEEKGNPEHFDTFPTMNELRYHEWILKNPRPPWVKAKIRTGDVNNVKFSCMVVQFNKEQAYLDLESRVNIMSRIHYN